MFVRECYLKKRLPLNYFHFGEWLFTKILPSLFDSYGSCFKTSQKSTFQKNLAES